MKPLVELKIPMHHAGLQKMFKGDPLCEHKPGDFVVKKKGLDKNYKHKEGTMGVVKGSARIKDQDCYLVDFGDGQNNFTFIVGTKIEKA